LLKKTVETQIEENNYQGLVNQVTQWSGNLNKYKYTFSTNLIQNNATEVVEFGARMVGDQDKLSSRFGQLKELIVEADYWARKGGGSAAEVTEIKRPRVFFTAGGKRGDMIIGDFKEHFRRPVRTPNPKRRITADSWRNLSDYEVDQVAHNGNLKATRTAAKRELARRGVKWTGEGVADRIMGRTTPQINTNRRPS
jgi:hypothetical protein